MAEALAQVWPTYNGQGKYSHTYFGSLIPRYADFQIVIYHPSTDRVVARGRSIPFVWDGTLADLPAGIDAVGWRALEDRRTPTALSALAAEVAPDLQGQGLSRLVLQALCDTARDNRLGPFVAPVRPSWKDRYPLIPIDHYAYWRRDDGILSTRGCESTVVWARPSCQQSPAHSRSKDQSPTGRTGPAWNFRRTAIMSFPSDWHRSTSKMGLGSIGSRTYGCSMKSEWSRPA